MCLVQNNLLHLTPSLPVCAVALTRADCNLIAMNDDRRATPVGTPPRALLQTLAQPGLMGEPGGAGPCRTSRDVTSRVKLVLWAVRWYCRYGVSYRDLEEMMGERGISVDHSTIYRWVQRYAPEM